jgi:hypothetical protein
VIFSNLIAPHPFSQAGALKLTQVYAGMKAISAAIEFNRSREKRHCVGPTTGEMNLPASAYAFNASSDGVVA